MFSQGRKMLIKKKSSKSKLFLRFPGLVLNSNQIDSDITTHRKRKHFRIKRSSVQITWTCYYLKALSFRVGFWLYFCHLVHSPRMRATPCQIPLAKPGKQLKLGRKGTMKKGNPKNCLWLSGKFLGEAAGYITLTCNCVALVCGRGVTRRWTPWGIQGKTTVDLFQSPGCKVSREKPWKI